MLVCKETESMDVEQAGVRENGRTKATQVPAAIKHNQSTTKSHPMKTVQAEGEKLPM